MYYYLFISCISVASAVLLTLMSLKIVQILQLSSYRARGVDAWFKSTKFDYMLRYFSVSFFAFICMCVYVACFGKYEYVKYVGLIFFFFHALLFVGITHRAKNKTPLKFTPRVIRLVVLIGIIFCAASFGLLLLGAYIHVKYSILAVLPVLIPILVLFAHFIMLPFETLNNLRYESKARKKLANSNGIIKIGITGSYGKTTAKNILNVMLEEKYNVLYSPSSYNTPLGIARVVNYELNDSHNVFIAEMGARYKGDIARLCRLVKPDIGIVTTVGNQHLETFGSVENIAKTKFELIEGLHENGVAVLSSDNEYTRQMYDKTNCKKYLAGVAKESDVSYDNVNFGKDGTSFNLNYNGKSERVTVKLLGRHIPSLVSVCAAAAIELGMELNVLAQALQKLQPVEHRLQLIENGDVTVIDDAYNSNPVGARNALEVLKAFDDGVRIIITPGLVELGDDEQKENYELGKCVNGCADYAYFVGARAEYLKNGAVDGGMAEDKVFIVQSLDDAVKQSGLIEGKKTILFENDLPDNL